MASSINGIGTTFYGKRDFQSDGSYVTTKWFILAFLPIFPSYSLRVIPEDEGLFPATRFHIVENLSICWAQVLSTYAYVYLLFFGAFHIAEKYHWKNSSQIAVLLIWAALPAVLRFIAKGKAAP
ncbi:MAG TPA: hypothetical protein VFF03_02785 [Rhodocyclaceae bacterium]|nr:hypothetical protein [Rhodocyclaceae bacterium]